MANWMETQSSFTVSWPVCMDIDIYASALPKMMCMTLPPAPNFAVVTPSEHITAVGQAWKPLRNGLRAMLLPTSMVEISFTEPTSACRQF